MNTGPDRLVIVTGLSGAGKSCALKVLEDLGYEVIDNFPLSLMEPLLAQEASHGRNMAVGIDTRTRGFNPEALVSMKDRYKAKLLFITCDDQILQKRFTETRRSHPMAKDRPVGDGITCEHELLSPLASAADNVIDTTSLSIHDLKRNITGIFSLEEAGLMITIMSFGYKNGLPRESDLVLDVRFLKNPHWDEALRPLTGQTSEVGEYIEQDENFAPFLETFHSLLDITIPRYAHEGKNYLTVAIGCTGGKHRSVYVTEKTADEFRRKGYKIHITHRDMPQL